MWSGAQALFGLRKTKSSRNTLQTAGLTVCPFAAPSPPARVPPAGNINTAHDNDEATPVTTNLRGDET